MKKRLILVTIIASLTASVNGQTVFKLDSIHQYSWDNGMMSWRFDTRDLYTYDNGGIKETNLLRLNWNGVDWDNFYQFNKTYNGNNDLTQSVQQNWNGGTMSWDDSQRDSYSYNASNLVSVYSYAIWNGANWMTFADNQYAYDGMGNRIEDVRRDLDFIAMTLVNTSRTTYNYSGSLLQDTIYEEWRDFLNDWENEDKTDFTYDVNDNILLVEERGWQSASMMWSDPFQRSQYFYNPSQELTEILNQTFGSGSWNNTSRILNTYNSGNLTELLNQEWNSGTGMWDNANRQLRTFDVDDNEIELIYESWDAIGSVWEGFLRLVKFWSPPETLGISIDDELGSLKVYPNPVSSRVTFSFEEVLREQTTVLIYSLAGQLINQLELEQGVRSKSVQVSYLKPGSYIFKIKSANRDQVFKVIKK